MEKKSVYLQPGPREIAEPGSNSNAGTLTPYYNYNTIKPVKTELKQ